MAKNTNGMRLKRGAVIRYDSVNRKLLSLLATDATRSFAELGRLLNMSPPAVHERVKKLKAEGVIRGVVAAIDGEAIGRPLLAFVHVDTHNWAVTQQLLVLKQFPEVEEIHVVAGETAMVLKVRTRDTQELNSLLAHINSIEGFDGTRTFIALSTYLERGPIPHIEEI